MEIKFNLSNTEHKELVSYCNLNDLLVSEVVKKSFTTGFSIERYGLLSDGAEVVEKVVEKIVEKRVEIPVEVEKEVIREVEKPVIDNSKSQMLQETIQKLRGENIEKDKQIKELEKRVSDLSNAEAQRGAVYLRGSNLNDTLYK